MHLAIKNLFQSDEIQVLIAGVAKLIFDFCYSVNFGHSCLLNVDAPPQLGIGPRSIKTLQTQAIVLKIFFMTLKGPTQVTLQIKHIYPDISHSVFEIRT